MIISKIFKTKIIYIIFIFMCLHKILLVIHSIEIQPVYTRVVEEKMCRVSARRLPIYNCILIYGDF
jgi:hypothetical protein